MLFFTSRITRWLFPCCVSVCLFCLCFCVISWTNSYWVVSVHSPSIFRTVLYSAAGHSQPHTSCRLHSSFFRIESWSRLFAAQPVHQLSLSVFIVSASSTAQSHECEWVTPHTFHHSACYCQCSAHIGMHSCCGLSITCCAVTSQQSTHTVIICLTSRACSHSLSSEAVFVLILLFDSCPQSQWRLKPCGVIYCLFDLCMFMLYCLQCVWYFVLLCSFLSCLYVVRDIVMSSVSPVISVLVAECHSSSTAFISFGSPSVESLHSSIPARSTQSMCLHLSQ